MSVVVTTSVGDAVEVECDAATPLAEFAAAACAQLGLPEAAACYEVVLTTSSTPLDERVVPLDGGPATDAATTLGDLGVFAIGEAVEIRAKRTHIAHATLHDRHAITTAGDAYAAFHDAVATRTEDAAALVRLIVDAGHIEDHVQLILREQLECAAQQDDVDWFEWVVAAGYDVRGDVATPSILHAAVMHDAPAFARAGIVHGLRFFEAERATVLQECVASDAGRALTVLLECGTALGLDVDATDEEGRTLVHTAAVEGSTECLRVLLDRGADALAGDIAGATPLHAALLDRQLHAAMILVSGGGYNDAAAAAGPAAGRTPLCLAAMQAAPDVLRALLARGARPAPPGDRYGQQPMDYALHGDDADVVALLHERMADGAGAEAEAEAS